MTWLYPILAACILVAECALVYELHQARREMRAMRDDVPKWVGVSVATQLFMAAVRFREKAERE